MATTVSGSCAICYQEIRESIKCIARPKGGEENGGGGGGGVHSFCRACLNGTVIFNLDPQLMAKNGGAIPCPSVECPAEPWSLEHLSDSLDSATFVAYGAAMRYILFDAPAAKLKAEKDLASQVSASMAEGLVHSSFRSFGCTID